MMNMALQEPTEFDTMIILTTLATTSTRSIVNKESTTGFSGCIMMVKILHYIVLVMSFLQQQYNLQPIVSDWGRTMNQFRRLCLPSTQSLSSVEDSELTYSSLNSLNTTEDDNTLDETQDDEDDATTDDDEDKLICEINTHADHYRLCKAEAAHDSVLVKIDASLPWKPLTANEAPHLDTKSLIAKLDDVAKTVDLDVSTILAEQIEDPVLGTVRSWLQKGISPEAKSTDIQQSKGLL